MFFILHLFYVFTNNLNESIFYKTLIDFSKQIDELQELELNIFDRVKEIQNSLKRLYSSDLKTSLEEYSKCDLPISFDIVFIVKECINILNHSIFLRFISKGKISHDCFVLNIELIFSRYLNNLNYPNIENIIIEFLNQSLFFTIM